jgi:hypothetical protein
MQSRGYWLVNTDNAGLVSVVEMTTTLLGDTT